MIKRVGALENANLDIDEIDDKRVDAGIAIFDTGVDFDHPDLNVVAGVDCTAVADPETEECAEYPGAGDDSSSGKWHGTLANRAAGIDRPDGFVGMAPGARIYALDEVDDSMWSFVGEVGEKEDEYEECLKLGGKSEAQCAEQTSITWDLAPAIAATRWVTAHADEIDVAMGGPARICSTELIPANIICGDSEQVVEYREAIEEMVDAGVVFVTVATPARHDVSIGLNGGISEDAIVVSTVADGDGLPGGKFKGDPCPNDAIDPEPDADDTLWGASGVGEGVAIAGAACALSDAMPQVAGAAALLASVDHPESRADVEAIRETLIEAGNSGEIAEGGWHDDSGDGFKEPLLDVSSEQVFDPVMLTNSQALDSDVNGDKRADLVSLRASGVVYVHPGGTDSKFATGVSSFSGAPLDPAQYDGEGHYVVDVADVDGDKRADLITMSDEGDVHLYAGQADYGFEEEPVVSELGLTPGLLTPGGDEPIAVADVTGGGRADLVVYDSQGEAVEVYRGRHDGHFAPPIAAREEIHSALHTDLGHHFVDVADVDGNGRADLITLHNGGIAVFDASYAWAADGELVPLFSGPSTFQGGQIDPAMDDGKGYEPIGAGDVTGDGKADLLLAKANSTYLYPASAGSFGNPVSFKHEGAAISTTFDSTGACEFFGPIDVNGDNRADVGCAVHAANQLIVSKGKADGSFESPIVSEGSFPSTQHLQNQSSAGNEFVIEKPAWRRRGCTTKGCLEATTPNRFEAEAHPATLSGQGSLTLSEPGSSPVQCEGIDLQGELSAPASELELQAQYGECLTGGSWPTTVQMHSCGYELHLQEAGASPPAALGIACEEPGDAIEYGFYFGKKELEEGKPFCTVTVPPQQGLQGLWPGNVGAGKARALSVQVDVEGLEWENHCSEETLTSGELSGELELEASDEEEEQIGLFLEAWLIEPTHNVEGTTDNRLTDVSCLSAGFCMATANLLSGTTSWSYGEVWDGDSWNGWGGIPENEHTELKGVSCTSSTKCITVGRKTKGFTVETFAAHWDGSKWTRPSTHNVEGTTDNRLTDVSCASASFCMAAANLLSGTTSWSYAEIWDGSKWSGQGSVPENEHTELNGVSCTGANECVFVGHKLVEGKATSFAVHWDGEWTRQPTPNPAGGENRLTDVSCTSASFCMATGNLLAPGGPSYAYSARWDGEEWVLWAIPDNLRTELRGLSCTSATDCTAIGSYSDEAGKRSTRAYRWDGAGWTRQPTPNAAADGSRLEGASCVASGPCRAVGHSTQGSGAETLAVSRP